MGIGAAIIGGGLISAAGANKAAKAGEAASNNTVALQREVYNDTTERLQPFTDIGLEAVNPLMIEMGLREAPEGYNPLTLSPSSQFALEQGRDTIESGAAARGGLFSGRTAAGLEGLRFGMAAQDRDNQLNRLMGLAQMGQSAAAGQGSAGINFANGAGNAMMQGANARAAGAVGVGNAFNDAIGNYVGYQQMNRLLG